MDLPLPTELHSLIQLRTSYQTLLGAHQALSSRLLNLIEARSKGNKRMQLEVELVEGTNFWGEGVVEDTETVYVDLGKEGIWLEMNVEKAREFVEKRCGEIDKRMAVLEIEVDRLKRDHELVAKTLRKALELDEGGATTS